MTFERAAGILLHPTSLHGRYGIGDLGSEAYQFVDWLQAAGARLWQILPLGPTGYGDSPYQCFSAFAGNHMLISPDYLARINLLAEWDLAQLTHLPSESVDFGAVIPAKLQLLRTAFENFKAQADDRGFNDFCAAEQAWLDDYALFMACKAAHNGASWTTWESAIALHEPEAVAEWSQKLADDVQFHKFLQWAFFNQWDDLKRYANEREIKIVGDIPIFVAHDSADVWGNRSLFLLHPDGNPVDIAGVPPDYFSATGQRWGNPLYRWDVMAQDGYQWWQQRISASLRTVDIVRIDHFRGFAGYWAVPGTEETAVNGEWRRGPGADFFQAIAQAFGSLPLIAEDLGMITPDVYQLRDQFALPGMRILQFAFTSGAFQSNFLPHTYVQNTVAYTGSHDNDTSRGWYNSAGPEEQHRARTYLHCGEEALVWTMIRTLYASVADTVIIPMQDALDLGTEARMNRPGLTGGNWAWRIKPDQLSYDLAHSLYGLAEVYGRLAQPALSKELDPNAPPYFDLQETSEL